MTRSFGLVDQKVAEADFFLEQLKACVPDIPAARYQFSAFVSAARSITLSIQAVIGKVDGFDDWYSAHQIALRNNDLARFFLTARNLTQKTGDHPIRSGTMQLDHSGRPSTRLWFKAGTDFITVPAVDVETACHDYFVRLVALVLDCYEHFGAVIDSRIYFTRDAFEARGLTIDDADEECMGVRGWTRAPGVSEEERWRMIRRHFTGCEIDHIFMKYLGKVSPTPE